MRGRFCMCKDGFEGNVLILMLFFTGGKVQINPDFRCRLWGTAEKTTFSEYWRIRMKKFEGWNYPNVNSRRWCVRRRLWSDHVPIHQLVLWYHLSKITMSRNEAVCLHHLHLLRRNNTPVMIVGFGTNSVNLQGIQYQASRIISKLLLLRGTYWFWYILRQRAHWLSLDWEWVTQINLLLFADMHILCICWCIMLFCISLVVHLHCDNLPPLPFLVRSRLVLFSRINRKFCADQLVSQTFPNRNSRFQIESQKCSRELPQAPSCPPSPKMVRSLNLSSIHERVYQLGFW